MLPIQKIQKWMKENGKDVFIINRTDEFLNEYVAPYAERLKWISNFSGSAGRAIIEINKAYIFVDGRYTFQANQEIDSNYFQIKHLKNYWSHLKNYIRVKKVLLIDPNLHSIGEVKKISYMFKDSKVKLNYSNINPIDLHWEEQPNYPNSLAFIHLEKYTGENSKDKIKKIQNNLKLKSIDFYILSSLDSIAWLLNIRGNDIKYTPLLFCYAIIPIEGKVELFVDKKKTKLVTSYLNELVNLLFFNEIEEYINKIPKKKIIGLDINSSPYIFNNICKNNDLKITYYQDPCLYLKAVKNKVELSGARSANIRDGVSVSKFLYWLKNKIIVRKMNEIKAANYLENLRKKNDLYYSSSFETVSASGSHAALPHYQVSKKTNINFKDDSIYLVDSGAQYYDGTTDITRTVILGTATQEQKNRFTRVLKGHIAVARFKILKNTKSSEIDEIARKALKEINCDYDHGTGHGIGSFLSVHEGPQRISKSVSEDSAMIKEGMILSNEPGFYKEGEYGIRIENLIICCLKEKNHLFFETISWAPIDRDLIDISLLSKKEILWINKYHTNVYKRINKHLDKDEKVWLGLVTSPLSQ